jgi:hypothetical protein
VNYTMMHGSTNTKLTVVYIQFVRNFTDHCHRLETYLHFINILSYEMLHRVSNVDVFLGMTTLRAVVKAVMRFHKV